MFEVALKNVTDVQTNGWKNESMEEWTNEQMEQLGFSVGYYVHWRDQIYNWRNAFVFGVKFLCNTKGLFINDVTLLGGRGGSAKRWHWVTWGGGGVNGKVTEWHFTQWGGGDSNNNMINLYEYVLWHNIHDVLLLFMFL